MGSRSNTRFSSICSGSTSDALLISGCGASYKGSSEQLVYLIFQTLWRRGIFDLSNTKTRVTPQHTNTHGDTGDSLPVDTRRKQDGKRVCDGTETIWGEAQRMARLC